MSRTIREQVIHPITIRELRVVRARDVTPGMRRVTLAGEQLGAFESNGFAQPPFHSPGFDDHIRLVFCHPDEDEPVLPIQRDGTVEFTRGRRPLARTYTVRRWDPDAGELDVDFVTHAAGVATTWARRCAPGDRIHIAGPAHSELLPAGVDWLLVAGDETALPAIGRLLAQAPAGLRAQVFIEVAEAAHRQDLATAADASITWLHRDGAAPGTTTLLADAVRAAPWWEGEVYAWVAGEATSITPIRRFLTRERGVDRQNVEVTGYWRRETVDTPDARPVASDPADAREPFQVLHDMGELLPPLALRTAVTLGIPALMADGASAVADLAESAGAEPVALGKLLRYLSTLDVVAETESGHYALTRIGDLLTEDLVADVLDLDGATGRAELGFLALPEAVRTGRASYASTFGTDYAELRADAGYEASYQEQIAKYAAFVAPALAADPLLSGASRVVVHGDGPGVLARALTDSRDEVTVSIVGRPSTLEYLRGELGHPEPEAGAVPSIGLAESFGRVERGPADVVVLARALDEHPDADAVRLLRDAAAALRRGGAIAVVDRPLDEHSADDHAAAEDLKQLVLHGTGHRTDREHRALFEAAGLPVAATRTVGWGFTLYELRRA